MKHLRFTTILLLIIFCIIPIVSILMIHHLTLTDTLSKMGTGTFGESSAVMKIDGFTNIDDIIASAENESVDVAIYMDCTDESGTVRSIYFNGKYPNFPMKSGRFFKTSDFKTDNYVCVIGKNRTDATYKNNGNTYISISGVEYKVIGVIGYESPTVLDSYIFVNMHTSDKTESGLFIYDFINVKESENNIENIKGFLHDRNISAELRSEISSFSESVMPKVLSARWFICVLAACFLCLWLISMKWIDQQKRDLCIRRLVGASKKDIILLIVRKYITVFAVSFIVGFIYCNVIYPAYFASMMVGYMVCVGFIILFLFWSVYRILRLPIEEVVQ